MSGGTIFKSRSKENARIRNAGRKFEIGNFRVTPVQFPFSNLLLPMRIRAISLSAI